MHCDLLLGAFTVRWGRREQNGPLDTYRDALHHSPGSNTYKGALPKFPMFLPFIH